MITDEQARQLLHDMNDDKPLYLFMDEQEKVLDSKWLPSDTHALTFAWLLGKKHGVVNVLRYVGTAE